ncbi:putative bifunctional diguanylate cyclase/phosphodiesterase [Puerhibacterium puerhi]|uniref:putative bifunctional diguanylate cyclase/phosphodiesterase n=1 Tax=Puerhibacterium puerhi TaxID=2692623 RepID=UPI00135ABE5E|nr:EAL domain-containing protein [Puerhibacterium puerhi]
MSRTVLHGFADRVSRYWRPGAGEGVRLEPLLRLVDHMPAAVMTVDPATLEITYLNAACRRAFADVALAVPVPLDALVGTPVDMLLGRDPDQVRRLLAGPGSLPERSRQRFGERTLEALVWRLDGLEDVGPLGVLLWHDVSSEIEAATRAGRLARQDGLTGLLNRDAFQERLDLVLAAPGQEVCLLYVDLDGFKTVNDVHGHLVGDALIRQAATRLRDTADRAEATVGRVGADEFVVLLPYGDTDRAAALAQTIVDRLGRPYRLGTERQARVGASVGIAQAPAHGTDAETLVARADMAQSAAKDAGKGSVRLFADWMEEQVRERVRLEVALRRAIDGEDGLFVFYQPIVDIETGTVTGREALARWHEPRQGWVSPGRFVPVAEESGLIEALGRLVLRRACQDAAGWAGGERVAVNVSAQQLGRGTLVEAVLSALSASGLAPDRLELEVTETALLPVDEASVAELTYLREAGVRVALDDFGTGYSSLAHLRAFPFDKIKIDGSFVREAVERADSAAVVRAVAELGRRLDVTTVAEGVETQDQLDRVRSEGCVEVQGYLYGRPEPSEQDAVVVAGLGAHGG